jgi:hypothetical protein
MQRVGRPDPAAPRGQHAPEEYFMNFSVADKMSAKSFNEYMRSHEPHDVTHPHATQGHVCLPSHILFATHEPLMPLLRMQIRRVWTCVGQHGRERSVGARAGRPAHLGEVREGQVRLPCGRPGLDNRRGSVVRAGSALHAARVLRCSLDRRLASLHRGASTCLTDKATHVKGTSKNKLRGAARPAALVVCSGPTT